MDRTIRVSGEAQLKLRPDTAILALCLEGVGRRYQDAADQADSRLRDLQQLAEREGFACADLKTEHFRIEGRYVYRKHRDGKNEYVQDGYRYCHRLNLRFPLDQEKLARLLQALSEAEPAPEVNVRYTVEDQEAARRELLTQAVADARQKAQVLSTAAGAELGQVLTIADEDSSYDFYNAPVMGVCRDASMAPAGAQMELETTVSITWALV